MHDIFGNEVKNGALVAVSRQVGYSVGQYAATVLDSYEDKYGVKKVKVEYVRKNVKPGEWDYGIPEKPQSVGLDKVVVVG